MLFGKKTPEGKTYLLLDIENGSVAGGLLRHDNTNDRKLFGETRVHLPVLYTRDSSTLLGQVREGVRHVLEKVTEVASRLRNSGHEAGHNLGTISGARVFVSAPWGVPSLSTGAPTFEEPVRRIVQEHLDRYALTRPTFVSSAGAVTAASRALLPYDDTYLLCIVSGEITEFVLIVGGAVAGYATMPMGRHIAIRTLRSHSGLSHHEARSAIRINAPHIKDADGANVEAFAEQLGETIAPLLKIGAVDRVYIVSVEQGEWLAQSLAASRVIAEMFPRGGTARALRHEHVSPYLAAHAPQPDLLLMLESLAM